MIAVDTNLLVYAHRVESEHHEKAKLLVNELRNDNTAWAIPWPCIHEFIGVITNPRIFKNPTPIETAFTAVDTLGMAGNLYLLSEASSHLKNLYELSIRAKLSGPRIHDARIAALCLSHGVQVLWSADRDFSLFPGLKTHNPLLKT
ncbi:MAG: Ribonuclease VapC [Verrucomicrobiales bacterium]|nr:Ribonuclease VapC [Verrucomicrobiales bacterium]